MAEPQAQPQTQADHDVYIRDAYGDVRKGPASQLKQALDAGATVLTPQEVAQHEAEKQYGGLGYAAASAGIGAVDMLSLGYGKGLATAVGGQDVGQAIKGITEAHPTAETAGQVAGIVAPALFSGGSSLEAEAGEGAGLLRTLGRGLAAPTDAVGMLGGIGEDATASLVGRGAESTLGSVAQKALASGARGMVEGSVYGGGQAFSDAEIDNHPLTADLLLAGMKKGGEFGGGIGLAFGAGAGLLGKVGEHIAEKAGNTDLVGELGLRSAGARLPEINQLTRKGIDPNTIGRFMVDELPQYSDKSFMRMSKEEMRDAAKMAVEEAGKRIGAGIDELSAIAEARGGIKPNMSEIIGRVDQEVIAPLRKLPGFESEVSQLEKYTKSFAEKGSDATFRDLNDFRKALDQKIFKGGKAPPPDSVLEELLNARRIIEDEAEQQGKLVAGDDWVKRYQGDKAYFAKAKEAERIADKGAQRELGRNMVGISDMIMAGAGMAHGGPLGLVAGAAHHLLKEYGTQFAADMLHRAEQLQSIKAMAAKSDNLLGLGIGKFLGEAKQKTQTATTQATVAHSMASFENESKKIKNAAGSPEALHAHVSATVPPASVAPRLGAVMAQKHAQALTYLNQQIPKGAPLSPLVPTVTGKPSKKNVDAWMQKNAVYKDPIGTVSKNLQRGTLTHAHVEALRAMYPDLHAEMQQKAMAKLAELGAKGKTPPFAKLNRLGLLLGIPASPSQSPSFVQSQQALYSKTDQAASQSVGSPPPSARNQRGARSSLASGEDSLDERA